MNHRSGKYVFGSRESDRHTAYSMMMISRSFQYEENATAREIKMTPSASGISLSPAFRH